MLENFDRASRERGWSWAAQPAGVDGLADRWLRKRNEGLAWAVEVDGSRTRMKNLWFSIREAWERHPQRRHLLDGLLFGEYPLGACKSGRRRRRKQGEELLPCGAGPDVSRD